MTTYRVDKRSKRRFHYETAVALESIEGGVTSVARMFNVSEGGVYFETDTLIPEGIQIIIWIANSPFASDPGVYESQRVETVWCSPLNDSVYAYGYGVKRLEPAGAFAQSLVMSRFGMPRPLVGRLHPIRDSRRYPRKSLSESVYFRARNGHYKGKIRNISRSGLFIETSHRFDVGRSVRIVIPDNRFYHYLSITARIVRTNPRGIGLEIMRVVKRQSP